MNAGQQLLAGKLFRPVAETKDIRAFLGSHDLVGHNVPLVRIHPSGVSRQTKPFFALSQRLIR